MTTPKRNRLGALLVESLAQAVAIKAGRLQAARRHRRTIPTPGVTPPPRHGSSRSPRGTQ